MGRPSRASSRFFKKPKGFDFRVWRNHWYGYTWYLTDSLRTLGTTIRRNYKHKPWVATKWVERHHHKTGTKILRRLKKRCKTKNEAVQHLLDLEFIERL